MNNLYINEQKIDVIILESGQTIKFPINYELSITIESSDNNVTQSLDVVADKGRAVITGNIFLEKSMENVTGYNDSFHPHLGDTVLYRNELYKVYAFKNESEVVIKNKKNGHIVAHKGELSFLRRKTTFKRRLWELINELL